MTNELINEVKKVNRQAALFMKRRIPLLVARGIVAHNDEREEHLKRLIPKDRLPDTFAFYTTPQGFLYWSNITKALPSKFNYAWNK